MARNSRRKKNETVQRDFETQSLAKLIAPKPFTRLEDRRTFHPDGRNRAITGVTKHASEIRFLRSKPNRTTQKNLLAVQPRLRTPAQIPLCARRKIRTQVLHALQKTGRGVTRRKPRRTWTSEISCKG